MVGIYKITSPDNKIYIGQSIDIKKRWYQYRLYLAKSQRKLYESFKSFGYEKHLFEIIHLCQKHELNTLECYYINLYNACDHLNCAPGNRLYRTKEQILSDNIKYAEITSKRKKIAENRKQLKDLKNKIWIEKYKKSQANKQAIFQRKIKRAKLKQANKIPSDIWRFKY